MQSEAQIPHLATLLTIPLFPAKGVHGANEPQRLFALSRNKLSGGYTSLDFVTARVWCAITAALQPSTAINRGLNAVPKREHFFLSNPHTLISTDLSVGAPAGTHHSTVPRSILRHFTTTLTTVIKAPTVTF